MSKFSIHTLGCGSAKPTLRHQPSSTVIDFRDNLYMVDCGEGAQLAMQRHRLKMPRLSHIFLTHLHGDHVFGLPGLIGTMGLYGTSGSITIHTFREGKEILDKIFDFFCRDLPFEVNYNIIEPSDQIVYESRSLLVRSVRLEHRVPAVGYIFEEKENPRHINRAMTDFHEVPFHYFNNLKAGLDYTKPDGTVVENRILTTAADKPRKYAHISDTSYMLDMAERIGPVDLLFHETTYLNSEEKDATRRGHSTAAQAAMTARDSGSKYLLTGHYSSRYKDDNAFLKEAQEVFPNVILNHENLVVDLTKL